MYILQWYTTAGSVYVPVIIMNWYEIIYYNFVPKRITHR